MFDYIRYSNLKFSFDFNPFTWSCKYLYEGPSTLDPNLRIWYIRFFPLSVLLVIDDGTVVLDDETLKTIEKDYL